MPKPELDHALAQAIVDTVREPLLVLDENLRVIAANRSFYLKFLLDRQFTQGLLFGKLGEGQWAIPGLETLLQRVTPDETVLENYEVELDFPRLGRRILLLNVRKVFYQGKHNANILLGIEDITERRRLERESAELLRQKDLLLAEMQHRVANSLAIIASILLMKARTVTSEETRTHLEEAHKRVMSVATVQRHLNPAKVGESIELSIYLKQLCDSLAGSMVNDDFCSIDTLVGEASVSSATAVSIGLIVTELVINSLKHAFPEPKPGCAVTVSYEVNGRDWKLSVSDNGCGTTSGQWPPPKVGLGTTIVNALADQLGGRVDTNTSAAGTTVSVTHSTFKSLPKAA
jgi:two-component sensor histidine kinase